MVDALPLSRGKALVDDDGVVGKRIRSKGLVAGCYRVGLGITFSDINLDRPLRPGGETRTFRDALAERGYPVDADRYWVPLTMTEAVAETEALDDVDAIQGVFPVVFDADDKPRWIRKGWLYIFIDDHLWRECHSVGNGTFQEVDLLRDQGQDERSHRYGLPWWGLTLPKNINGRSPAIKMAYSEVQWSWEYICRLGGMHSNDPRCIPELNEAFDGIAVDADLREARLQTIKLEDIGKGDLHDTYLMPAGKASRAFNERRYPDLQDKSSLYYLPSLFRDSNSPIVALHDPIGQGRRLAELALVEIADFAQWQSGEKEESAEGKSAEHSTKSSEDDDVLEGGMHSVIIGRYVEQVIKADPEMEKHVRVEAMKTLLAKYNEREQALEQRLLELADQRLALLTDAARPCSLRTVFEDFEMVAAASAENKRPRAELGALAYVNILEGLSQLDDGKAFVVASLNDESSLLNQAIRVIDNDQMRERIKAQAKAEEGLGPKEVMALHQTEPLRPQEDVKKEIASALKIGKKGYDAFEALVSLLARPLAEANEHWERIKPVLEQMYGVRISAPEISYADWKRAQGPMPLYTGRGVAAFPINPNARFVPDTEVRVRVVHFNGVAAVSQRAQSFLGRIPPEVMLGIQVASLGFAWQDVFSKGIRSEAEFYAFAETVLKTVIAKQAIEAVVAKRMGQEVAGVAAKK
ncbi:hypothetical protein CAI21_09600 [Alkalilimnicola ehrlichii]|uniref:Uncharacterized protein n=1 Tax=Alkalilimnicola ehrlichii TaxID=351052 RepID=A0A3E0WXE2_9GAMM|nr:hypothetical protein CAI21_09600 [Alkalilimnicola ehrlichii]RFA36833.1 hypothetical protein CAL65_09935 [Alkalilimnicola ehrlichii]